MTLDTGKAVRDFCMVYVSVGRVILSVTLWRYSSRTMIPASVMVRIIPKDIPRDRASDEGVGGSRLSNFVINVMYDIITIRLLNEK